MTRVRVSTTISEELLVRARRASGAKSNAALFDSALEALLARERAAELDAGYAAYDEIPLDSHDQWGDLSSFRAAAAAS